MALKHLFSTGQLATATVTEVYKVPASGQVAISSIVVGNTASTTGTITIR
mgnify:FL=1